MWSVLKTLKNLNRKKRGKFSKVWEFENHIKERLRALGIIQ